MSKGKNMTLVDDKVNAATTAAKEAKELEKAKLDAFRKMLGGRLRSLRDSRGWSQDELAAIADTEQDYVSRVENGHRLPSIAWLMNIGEKFGHSVSELTRTPDEERRQRTAIYFDQSLTDSDITMLQTFADFLVNQRKTQQIEQDQETALEWAKHNLDSSGYPEETKNKPGIE